MVVQRTTESCEFRLYLPHASVVEVVGDFTAWQESAVAMERAQDGWWSALVRVPTGEHRFSYLVDGRYWMPDYAANGIEHNANGQWVSRLDVSVGADVEVGVEVGAAEGAATPARGHRRGVTPGRGAAPAPTISAALGAWLGQSVAARAG